MTSSDKQGFNAQILDVSDTFFRGLRQRLFGYLALVLTLFVIAIVIVIALFALNLLIFKDTTFIEGVAAGNPDDIRLFSLIFTITGTVLVLVLLDPLMQRANYNNFQWHASLRPLTSKTPFDRDPVAIANDLNEKFPNTPNSYLKFSKPVKYYALKFLALALFFFLSISNNLFELYLSLFHLNIRFVTLHVNLIAIALFVYLNNLADRYIAIKATALLESDSRPPVLFLRSFRDERISVWRNNFRNIATGNMIATLEIAIADVARKLGPFIAIGEPNERLPNLGAARLYAKDDEWQTIVQGLMDRAQVIVAVPAMAKWVRWELRQLLANKRALKSVILLPPKRREWIFGTFKYSYIEGSWSAVLEEFANTQWSDALQQVDTRRALMVFFHDNSLYVVVSKKKYESDYERGLALAIWHISNRSAAHSMN